MSPQDKLESTSSENLAETLERIVNDRDPIKVVDDDVVAIPENWRVQDLEHYQDAPRRIEVERAMTTSSAFARYVGAHAIERRTAVYVHKLRNISATSSGNRRDKADSLTEESARQLQTKIQNELPEHLTVVLPILSCEPDVLTTLKARLQVKLLEDGVAFCVQLVNPEVELDNRIRQFAEGLEVRIAGYLPSDDDPEVWTVPVYY